MPGAAQHLPSPQPQLLRPRPIHTEPGCTHSHHGLPGEAGDPAFNSNCLFSQARGPRTEEWAWTSPSSPVCNSLTQPTLAPSGDLILPIVIRVLLAEHTLQAQGQLVLYDLRACAGACTWFNAPVAILECSEAPHSHSALGPTNSIAAPAKHPTCIDLNLHNNPLGRY